MNYEETITYLFNSLPVYQRIGKAAYKADLETSLSLDKYFGSPHSKFKTIHIAGTNGKGSVSSSLASILMESGLKTGLYTSPHLRDFRERIKVDGVMIDKDSVVDFVKDNRDIIEELKPSFFEMTVAMAFQYFKEMKVDIAVIETGMGGRLDSTNIINPLISVITNISLDHTQFLGKTIEKIAGEKAGIIKESVPVVIGRSCSESSKVFQKIAVQKGSSITFADQEYFVDYNEIDYQNGFMMVSVKHAEIVEFDKLKINFAARYQLENIATTLCVCKHLNIEPKVRKKYIIRGFENILANTGLEGRWQILRSEPKVITDIAHNFDGLSRVLDQLKTISADNLRFILGFVDDKELDQIFEILPGEAEYYFTRASIPRSLDARLLQKLAAEFGISGRVFDSVDQAYGTALNEAGSNDLIYVGGSTFIVADLLELIR